MIVKNKKGITLIALIITIIIMLILSGVVLTLTIGENRIFKIAKAAGKNYVNAANDEERQISNIVNEIWSTEENKLTLVSQITPNDYGKKIDYSANGVSDWKIFYSDGINVYIITSDYLDMSVTSTTIDFSSTKMTRGSGKYIVYWNSTITTQAQAIETLTNTNNWRAFTTGKGGKSAIGTPTYEMLANSYNTNPKMNEKKLSSTAEVQIGFTDSSLLYWPYNARIDSCAAYWLATTSPNDNKMLMRVQYDGVIGQDRIGNTSNCGIRPVVCLKSETTGTVKDTVSID